MSKPAATIPTGPDKIPSQDPLAQLRDIHMPEPVSWWPPAPGWWLLVLLILVLLAASIFYWRRYNASKAYRREAIYEIKALHLKWQRDNNDRHFIEHTQLILRRAALSAYPREEIAALNGKDWVDWLNKAMAKNISVSDINTTDTGPRDIDPNDRATRDFDPLGTDLYVSEPAKTDIPKLYKTAQTWLKKHRRKIGQSHA